MHKKGLLVLRVMKFCLFSDHGVNNNKISGVSAGVWKLNIYFKESIQKKILSSRYSKNTSVLWKLSRAVFERKCVVLIYFYIIYFYIFNSKS